MNLPTRCWRMCEQRFFALVDTAVHPTPGLFVLLDHLARRRLPLAVATSSRRAYADRLLSQHGLLDRFQFILASEDVSRGKPDPEIYRSGGRPVRRAGQFALGPGRQPRGSGRRPGAGPSRSAYHTSTARPSSSRCRPDHLSP